MIGIDNSELKYYCKNCNCQDFSPGASYNASAAEKWINVTDTSVFDPDDTLKEMDVTVSDETGKKVQATVTIKGGSTTPLDVTPLDLTKKITLTVIITSKAGCFAIGTIVLTTDGPGKITEWTNKPIVIP